MRTLNGFLDMLKFGRSAKLVVFAVVLSGCVSKQRVEIAAGKGWNDEPGNSVRLSLEWYKKKKNRFDTMVILTNKYPFKVMIPIGGIQVKLDGVQGTSSGNEYDLVINPGDQVRQLVLVKFGRDLTETREAEIRLSNLTVVDEVEGEVTSTEEPGKVKKFFKKNRTLTKSFKGKVETAGRNLPAVSVKIMLDS